MSDRLEAWTEKNLLEEEQPEAVVHFAEQRAAPYSMKGPKEKIYTVHNNLNATHNLLCAVVERGLDTHVVHLGTMGVSVMAPPE
jgi:UDP-sulfoquinovose synthase